MGENKTYHHSIVIGDWSKDGHNQYDFFDFDCSHDENEIKDAYIKAVKQSGISLHVDYSNDTIPILCDYDDYNIPYYAIESLEKIGVDIDCFEEMPNEDDSQHCDPIDVAYLFMEMVKTQIPGFTYKEREQKKPLNGFWSNDFNYSFGYGVYQ